MSRGDSKRTGRAQGTRPTRGPRKTQEAKDARQPKRRRSPQPAQQGPDGREPKRLRKVKQAKDAGSAQRVDSVAAGHSAKERRTRQLVQVGSRGASFVFRHRAGNIVILVLMLVAAAQLFALQVTNAPALRAQAAGQLKVTDVEKAVRGSIIDRNKDQLAFTIESRALTFQPKRIHKQLQEAKAKNPAAPDPQQRLRDIAKEVSTRLGNKPDSATVLKKLQTNDNFAYLARAEATTGAVLPVDGGNAAAFPR